MFDSQITPPNERHLYVIDMDGVLFPVNPRCFPRFAKLAGHVAHAYTGMDYQKGEEIALQSFQQHSGDGFRAFIEEESIAPDIYKAMHRHFNMIVRIDTMCDESEIDPDLPDLIFELSKHHDVCFATHATTRSAQTTLARRDYNPILIQNCYGLDRLGSEGFALKSDKTSDVFSHLAKQHHTTTDKIILIEDTEANIQAALTNGIQRGIHIADGLTTTEAIKRELALVPR